MKTDDLRAELARTAAPPVGVVIDGPAQDASYVLQRNGRQWCVYYYERGLRVDERCYDPAHTADPEDAACTDMLRRLQRDFGLGAPRGSDVDGNQAAQASVRPDDRSDASAGDPQPWPRWVRYPVIALLVAAGAWGLTVAVTTGLTAAIARIVIAAVVVPTLLTPLALRGRRRRAERDDTTSPRRR